MGTAADEPRQSDPRVGKQVRTAYLTGWQRRCVCVHGDLRSEMLGDKDRHGAWHQQPPGTCDPCDPPPNSGPERSPGQRGSAAQNAVALLVHGAGLEQQPNTKGKVRVCRQRRRHRPGAVLGN